MAGPTRAPLRVWVNLPWNQQTPFIPIVTDPLGVWGDIVMRPADQQVDRLEDNYPLHVNISVDNFEIPGNISAYLRAQDPDLMRRADDAYIERLPDDPPSVRPSDNPDAARSPDNPFLERE